MNHCVECRNKAVFEHYMSGTVWNGKCWAYRRESDNPITGRSVMPGVCIDHNANGDCSKFERHGFLARLFHADRPDVVLPFPDRSVSPQGGPGVPCPS
jgi:hypothetical protein